MKCLLDQPGQILLDGFSTMPVACSDGMMEAASPVTSLKQLDDAVHWTLDFPVRSLKKREVPVRVFATCQFGDHSVKRKKLPKTKLFVYSRFSPLLLAGVSIVHWKFNFWNFGVVAWNLSKWSGTDSALNSLACKIFMWKFWAKKKNVCMFHACPAQSLRAVLSKPLFVHVSALQSKTCSLFLSCLENLKMKCVRPVWCKTV